LPILVQYWAAGVTDRVPHVCDTRLRPVGRGRDGQHESKHEQEDDSQVRQPTRRSEREGYDD
jgi:hypothetical protein